MRRCVARTALAGILVLAGFHSVSAATLCVKPGGGGGCYSTINAAVAASAAGDTIQVAPGTYAEDVIIGKRISLVGENRSSTIIDATGLANGINIDGFHHAGLAGVVVTGFTVKGANFEGIFITNASNVSVTGNKVVRNNLNLNFPTCPGLEPPDSQAGEGFDCGEGIHLSAVDHSIVSFNIVKQNAGGILLSDDSGPTHDNLISTNSVKDNAFDCGITLASHKPVAPNGVYHNTLARNDVLRNGLLGQGAGVGMFTPIPGTATYGNLVIGNRAIGNGLPGVAMHSHAPGQNLNDNSIVGNYIADNGADDDAGTPGTTGIVVFGVSPVTGTTISENVIKREDIAIAVKTESQVDAHLNDLETHTIGVANLDGGTVDAIENWWGCSGGPGAPGCAGVSGAGIMTAPWLSQPVASKLVHP